jgi:hypothetical protein
MDTMNLRRSAYFLVPAALLCEVVSRKDYPLLLHTPIADLTGETYEWLRKNLCLPEDCRVTGVSPSIAFVRNAIAVRVCCPEFPEVADGKELPRCEPQYDRGRFGSPFVGWRWCEPEAAKPLVVESGGAY